MTSKSARLYLEAKGIIYTRRCYHEPILDPNLNIARRNPLIFPAPAQLVMSDYNSPDHAGPTPEWPDKEPRSVP